MTSDLRTALETILSRYARARSAEEFGKSNPVWGAFDSAADALRAHPGVCRFDNLRVRWSAGRGRWATVPWLAVMDTRETTTMTTGVYVIYLVRADTSGLYLTLNQGTSGIMAGFGGRGLHHLRKCALMLRERCSALKESGFTVEDGIDLRSNVQLVRGYEASTVAYKLYERGSVPDDAKLVGDLVNVLTVYKSLVPSRRFLSVG